MQNPVIEGATAKLLMALVVAVVAFLPILFI